MHVALATDPFQPRELGERLRVIVDPQIEIGPIFFAVDEDRRRLPAALVAAGRLARLERRDQPARKRQGSVVAIGRGGRLDQ